MKFISRFTDRLYRSLVCLCFFIITIVLILMAGFSTEIIGLPAETTWFDADHILPQILIAAAVCMAAYLILRHTPVKRLCELITSDRRAFELVRGVIVLIIVSAGIFIVYSYQVVPSADQANLLTFAAALNRGDTSSLEPGGYLQGRHNQFGMVFLLQFYVRVFGETNYIPFQIFNAVMLGVVWYELSEIAGLIGVGRPGQIAVMAFGVIFLPLTLYVTFFYGTMSGLAFALIAVHHVLLFGQRGLWRDAVLTAFCGVFACVLKNNYEIFLIAIVIYALVAMIRKREPRWLVPILLTAALFAAQGAFLQAYFSALLGSEVADGMSFWSYIAMGLQEPAYGSAEGWYNGYNAHSFEEAGYDASVQATNALASIAERLQYFAQNPSEALRFFGNKIASEWNNPLFQGDWVVEARESDIIRADWTYFLSYPAARQVLVNIYNIVQFLVLFGCLSFAFLPAARRDHDALLIEMIFVGGFLFQIFWEAKAQYTISFWVCLVPLSATGYQALIRAISACTAPLREVRASSASVRGTITSGLRILLAEIRGMKSSSSDASASADALRGEIREDGFSGKSGTCFECSKSGGVTRISVFFQTSVQQIGAFLGILIILEAAVIASYPAAAKRAAASEESTEAWDDYVTLHTSCNAQEGIYVLRLYNTELYLTLAGGPADEAGNAEVSAGGSEETGAAADNAADETQGQGEGYCVLAAEGAAELEVELLYGTAFLYETVSGQVLTASDADESGVQAVSLGDMDRSDDAQQWYIWKMSEEGTCIILCDDGMALTYDEESGCVCVEAYCGSTGQIWVMESV